MREIASAYTSKDEGGRKNSLDCSELPSEVLVLPVIGVTLGIGSGEVAGGVGPAGRGVFPSSADAIAIGAS